MDDHERPWFCHGLPQATMAWSRVTTGDHGMAMSDRGIKTDNYGVRMRDHGIPVGENMLQRTTMALPWVNMA